MGIRKGGRVVPFGPDVKLATTEESIGARRMRSVAKRQPEGGLKLQEAWK